MGGSGARLEDAESEVLQTYLRNAVKDRASFCTSQLQITASFDSSSSSRYRVIQVMMTTDDVLDGVFVTHDVTSEVPLVT